MRTRLGALGFALLLLMPAYAASQTPDRIIVDRDLGEHGRGDHLFVHGILASPDQAKFVIVQVANPRGELCSIQQIQPLSEGQFVTKAVPLRGALCGIDGEYDVRIFFGEHSQSSSFVLSGPGAEAPEGDDTLRAAHAALDARIARTQGLDTAWYTSRALALVGPLDTIEAVEQIYVDLLGDSFTDSSLEGLDVTLRRAIRDAIDATGALERDSVISTDAASEIRDLLWAAIMYHEAGDARSSYAKINEAYVDIRIFEPSSGAAPDRPPTFEELESTVLSLMMKSGSLLSKDVRSDLSFILSRGTAPIHIESLNSLVNVLTHARYLDIVERKDDDLHKLITGDWVALRPRVTSASTIEATVALEEQTSALYGAAMALRDLDKVENFVNGDRAGDLGMLLRPDWNKIVSDIRSASSTEDIMNSVDNVTRIKGVVDISSRLEQVIRLTSANGIETDITRQWPDLLSSVGDAGDLDAILLIVKKFEESIQSLREARSPLSSLELEYRALRAKADQQSDRAALANIDNALNILDLAQKLSSGNPTEARRDRVEVLVAWVVQEADAIRDRLNSNTDVNQTQRAASILERANSLESLGEIGLRTKRFVPGYSDYVDEVKQKISRARELVISGELRLADDIVRNARAEWIEVDAAYRDDPPSSDDYGIVDVRRRAYTEQVDGLQNVAARFLVNGTEEAREMRLILDRAAEFTEHGNFVDAQEWITRAYEYAQDHLSMKHNSVIFDIERNEAARTWMINGFVEKQAFDRREDISVTVLHANNTLHSELEFTDTRHGAFSIPWNGPGEPGIYIAELAYRDTTSANIVYIPYDLGTAGDREQRQTLSGGSGLIASSRDLFDLREFMRGFGGERYQSNIGRIGPVVADAEKAILDRDEAEARSKVAELRALIERYLPQRSTDAAIRADYGQGGLLLEGAIKKSIAFPEDLYVDVFDQSGDLVTTVALTDDSNGSFSQSLVRSFEPGTHVVLLSYHDLRVSDFFTVDR